MAVGYTGSDPTKVSKSGDTMTGVLVLDDASPAASQDYVTDALGDGGAVTSVDDQTGAVDLSGSYDPLGAAAAVQTAAENFATALVNALGTAATHNATDFDAAGAAATAQAAAQAFATAAISALNLGSASTHASTDFDAAGAASTAQGNSLQKSSNLSDLANAGTARTNLGLGGAAVLAVGTTTSTVAAGDDSRIAGAAQKSSNLSDLGSTSTARTNLGLGTSAVKDIPSSGNASTGQVVFGNDTRLSDSRTPSSTLAHASTHGSAGSDPVSLDATQVTTGTLAIGRIPTGTADASHVALANDSRLSDARTPTAHAASHKTGGGDALAASDIGGLLITSNLSDLNNAGTARTNLGLGTAATHPATDFAQIANNLSDVTAATARTNLGVAYGSSGTTVCVGNDSRLSDTRTPSSGSIVDSMVSSSAAINLSKLARDSFDAADHAMAAWNLSPYALTSQTTAGAPFVAGTVNVAKLLVPVACTVTSIWMWISTVGATLTANQCLAALYDGNKNLLQTTANQATAWTSSGIKQMAITAQTLSAGACYVAWFYNGTTVPRWLGTAAGVTNLINLNLAAASALWATADTGKTTAMPSALGTFTALSQGFWAALS